MNTSMHSLAVSDLHVERIVRSLRIMGLGGISVFYPDPVHAHLARVGFPRPEATVIAAEAGRHWEDLVESRSADEQTMMASAETAPFAKDWAPLGGGVVETLIGMGLAEATAKVYAGKIRDGYALVLVHVAETDQEHERPVCYDAIDATDIA